MMTGYDYILFGQIQDIKERHYKETGKGLDFHDAVEKLSSSGAQKHGIPEIPDFLSWNLRNYRDLRKLIYRIPIRLSEVFSVRHHVMDNVIYLTTRNRVQISMESCYMSEQMIAIDHFSVIYVLEGTCTLSAEHTKRVMQPGELCILTPQIPYAVFTGPEDLVINIISDKTHFKENFHMLLYHDNLVSAFFRRALFQSIKESIFFMVPPSRDIRSILQHLFAEFVKKDTYSGTLFNNYLQIFYANIIRSTQSTYRFYANQEKTSARMLMPAILEYITCNYHSITLELLAAHFHYESAYLSKLIKASTGKNYSTIITELKVKEAAELLLTSDMQIEEIAEVVGYNSADHFSYSFKKITGTAPRAYRKSAAGDSLRLMTQ